LVKLFLKLVKLFLKCIKLFMMLVKWFLMLVKFFMCPMEEDLDVLMSSVLEVFICVSRKGRKSWQWGSDKGTKNGAVDSAHGASEGRGLQLRSKSHHSK
jgi:hypothetical protein